MSASAVPLTDWLALIFFVAGWVGYARYTDLGAKSGHLLAATNRYRHQWMREMLKRENRMMDATMVGNLQRSIAFFANTTIFILLGLMTMLGYHDRAIAIVAVIPFAQPLDGFQYELRIFLLIMIFIYAFFKYTWSLRQYNYAGIFINAAPSFKDRVDEHEAIAETGSYLVGNAAKHFNNGLRAYYFGLAALSWFVHSYFLMAATAWVIFVTYRREYRSATLKNLTRSKHIKG